MKAILLLLLLMLPFFTEVTQPCDTEKDFSEIEKLYKEGYFDQVLEKTEILEDCAPFSVEQY